jgi:hypothetical protein
MHWAWASEDEIIHLCREETNFINESRIWNKRGTCLSKKEFYHRDTENTEKGFCLSGDADKQKDAV